MKKILSICFLWAISCALWGQTRSGYGGDFNPDSPDNPKEPGLTLKYDFKVTAEKGGYVNCDPSGSQFTAGTNIYLNANPNTGYQFKCWMEKDSVISTSQWHYYTMPARDVELKAVFVFQPQVPNNPEVIPLDYRVTVEASPSYAGNVDCSREEVKVGSYTYVSASPYSGYKFAGWMLDGKQVSTDSYYHFEMESRNMHFIAMFEFNPDVPGNPSNNPNGSATYLLKYTIDGQVCHTEQLPEGAPITAIATPEKKGYTFSGWSAFPTVMPAHEVVISGSFIPNKYHVTYKVDGAVIHEEDVDYGTKLTPPEGEKKEGYTLTWTNLPDAMPDYDLVVEGTYVANVYSLTYIVDGQVYKNYEVVFATEITPEQEPVKEGHTFSGWGDVPKTMPAKDVVVTGTFSVNSYTITYMVDGKEYAKDTVSYGSEIVLPETPTKEGYTFSGWNDVPKTMPAKDVVVTGSFSINSYTIIYMVDGKEYAKYTVAYGSEIVLPETPTKEGYTFSGWNDVPKTMPAKDVVVTGSFSINSYTIIYMVDGKEYAKDTVAYGSEIVLPETPSKEGHTFSGWNDVPKTMPAKDVVVTGSFSINSYTIIYMVDGKEYAKNTVAYGSEIVLPETPSKEGHTFSGWNDVPKTMPAKDVVVTGTFSVNSYTITYMVDGKEYAKNTVAYGSEIVLPETPTKEGYTFSGWNDVPKTMPAKDVVVTGSFSINSYTITYMVDGEEYAKDTVAYGSEIVLPETPTKEGHTFSGWNDVPKTMPAKDVVVTGTFSVNSYTITYMVDGKEYAKDTVAYGSEIVLPETPTKEGYTFSGWNDVPKTMPAKDVVVTGTFSANSYTITYVVDGERYKSIVVEYGATIMPEEAPVKEGHTFSGWSEIPETMPAEDVTVTGSFTINMYLVVFKIGDEVISSDSLPYGSPIAVPGAPEKEGHTFSGWGEVLQYVPAYDVTFVGSYTVNVYKVYYYVGEELVHTEEVAYGAAMPDYEYEPNNGDVFNGWDGEHYDTMPAHDVVYIANITSSISFLQSSDRKLVVYDLNGRRIHNLNGIKSGLYIVNGKRVLLK